MVNFDNDNNVIIDETFRAITVGVAINEDISDSMEELGHLVEAADGEVLGKVIQNLDRPNKATFIGSGKVQELCEMAENMEANTIVFDHELSGMQIRNLEDEIGIKVIDRTILILDIFARRAKSREGKLQVELAQLRYRLPRLTGFGKSLSRLGGGIGTRGPGEKKIETDRRHVQRRIEDIKHELEETSKTRVLQREKRKKSELPVVALVGYTNVGKSAIMNYFVSNYGNHEKQVDEINMLFATLDAKHRLIELENNKKFILVDTVGFVSKLSHHLVDAFKGTLEEVIFADLILHVEDASSNDSEFQRKVAEKVLNEIGAGDKDKIMIYNKIDLLTQKLALPIGVELNGPVFISAKTGENMTELLEKISYKIFEKEKNIKFILPFERGDLASRLLDQSNILCMEYREDGIHMEAMLKSKEIDLVKEYVEI
ncbi:GTPase HflX [Eubacteriales bacterium KG127]